MGDTLYLYLVKPMPQFIVLDSLNHDNQAYEVGQEIELTTADAKPLLSLRVVAPAPKKPPNPTKPKDE
ncbi:hypothetical protein AB3R30_19800 [Leptolyngbyaceae cyanobacterium UHCC 1019]